jgi:hypothetical protein
MAFSRRKGEGNAKAFPERSSWRCEKHDVLPVEVSGGTRSRRRLGGFGDLGG